MAVSTIHPICRHLTYTGTTDSAGYLHLPLILVASVTLLAAAVDGNIAVPYLLNGRWYLKIVTATTPFTAVEKTEVTAHYWII